MLCNNIVHAYGILNYFQHSQVLPSFELRGTVGNIGVLLIRLQMWKLRPSKVNCTTQCHSSGGESGYRSSNSNNKKERGKK